MRKKNIRNRRLKALENLRTQKFFPKGERTEEQWEARRQAHIKILEERTA